MHDQRRFCENRSLAAIECNRLWSSERLLDTLLERAKSDRFQMYSVGLSSGAYGGKNS
jgi:hypothetical protein